MLQGQGGQLGALQVVSKGKERKLWGWVLTGRHSGSVSN